MALSTITSKGQITIPKEIREQLHLRTGDKLDFRLAEDGSLRVFPIAKKVSEVFGFFAHKASKPKSVLGIKRGLRRAFREGRTLDLPPKVRQGV